MMQKKILNIERAKGAKVSGVPTIFHETIECLENDYRYLAKFRFKDNFRGYKQCIGLVVRYYREKAKLSPTEITKYLGTTGSRWKYLEEGKGKHAVDFMLIDEFCTIIGIDLIDFYNQFRDSWAKYCRTL